MKLFDFTILRRIRKDNDITLLEVSKKTGLSYGFLSHLERGFIREIKNQTKRNKLIKYIKSLTCIFICVMLFAGSAVGQVYDLWRIPPDEITILSFNLDTVKNQIEVVKKVKRPNIIRYDGIIPSNHLMPGDNYIKEIYGLILEPRMYGNYYLRSEWALRLIKTIRGKLIPAQVTPERIEWEE